MNKKLIFAILLLAAIVSGISYIFLNSEQKKSEFINAEDLATGLTQLECDMGKEFACPVMFNGKKIEFSLSPKPIHTMAPVVMWINGLDGFEKPSLEIHGVNMDMGVIKANLEKREEEYRADIVLSACVITVMRYRFEVLDNGKRTGLYIDFDIRN